MNSQENISIYRFCETAGTESKLEKEGDKYCPGHLIVAGISYGRLINDILKNEKNDWALVVRENVVVPLDIKKRACRAIDNADGLFGRSGWALVGNYGVELLSRRNVKCVRDQKSLAIPSSTSRTEPAIYLDANAILLNVASLKEKGVSLPMECDDPNIAVLALLGQAYLHGLASGIDSELYAYLKYAEFSKPSDQAKNERLFMEYWMENFINHEITTTGDPIGVPNDLEYLKRGVKEKRKDFSAVANAVVFDKLKNFPVKDLYVATRTMLDRVPRLERLLETVNAASLMFGDDIRVHALLAVNNVSDSAAADRIITGLENRFPELDIEAIRVAPEKNMYGRVAALKACVEHVRDDDAFLWFVDDDDFVFPTALRYFPYMLDKKRIVVANSAVFEENWDASEATYPSISKKIKTFSTENFHETLQGDNHIPICSVVYPRWILGKVFEKYSLAGDYNEDYALFLLAQKEAPKVRHFPLAIAGVSFHQKNTVLENDRTHWNYSYATFMSEIVNSGAISDIAANYVNHSEDEIKKAKKGMGDLKDSMRRIVLGQYDELAVKAKDVWRKKGTWKLIKFFLLYIKHGRSYFRDGIDVLDKKK